MNATGESYQSTKDYVPFLRLETPRNRVALPYSTLLSLEISSDGTILRLNFVSKEVTVTGKRLHEIFCAIAKGQTEALFARSASDELTDASKNRAPYITDIRLKEPNEAQSD